MNVSHLARDKNREGLVEAVRRGDRYLSQRHQRARGTTTTIEREHVARGRLGPARGYCNGKLSAFDARRGAARRNNVPGLSTARS